MIIVVGRGNSGASLLAHTLSASGVYMGQLAPNYDHVPKEGLASIHAAVSLYSPFVEKIGNVWLFTRANSHETPPYAFTKAVRSYARAIVNHRKSNCGWKLPATALALPWVIKMFPKAHYIQWDRDPRDCIQRSHPLDDLSRFGVRTRQSDNIYEQRAWSWIYQAELLRWTPRPKRWLRVRYEDFVRDQESTIERIEFFTDERLERLPVTQEPIGRHHGNPDSIPGFLEDYLRASDSDYARPWLFPPSV